MNQAWLPLERSRPDLRLRSLNVVALTHSEDKKETELGGSLFGRLLNEGLEIIAARAKLGDVLRVVIRRTYTINVYRLTDSCRREEERIFLLAVLDIAEEMRFDHQRNTSSTLKGLASPSVKVNCKRI